MSGSYMTAKVESGYFSRALSTAWAVPSIAFLEMKENNINIIKILATKEILYYKCSIVSIGSYGCSKRTEDKYHLEAGLESMLSWIEPSYVIVYGSMNPNIFDKYNTQAKFIQIQDWTTCRHNEGGKNGHRSVGKLH